MKNKFLKLFNKKEVGSIQTSIPTNKKTKNFFEFQNKTNYRIQSTTKKWRNSINYAEDWERPDRTLLYKIYNELVLDSTIKNSIDLRTQRVLSIPFQIVNNKGKRSNDKLQDIFTSYWFEKYLKYAMDSIFYGHSLIQIDGIKNNNVTDVTLIPRENVVPEFGLFKHSDYVEPTEGLDYMQPKIYKWLCEVYQSRRDLGILNATAPYQIAKKTAIISWSQFVEKFGEPTVIGRTNSNLESEKDQLKDFLNNMSLNSAAVLDKQTDIEFKETTRTDSFNVYKELIISMNNEINTVILGGTEITSGGNGGSEARAKIHQAESNHKTAADIKYIKNNINSVLIPKLQTLKLIPKNVKFEFIYDENLSMEQKIDIDKEIMKQHKLSKDYLERTYKVEIEKPKEVTNETTLEENV